MEASTADRPTMFAEITVSALERLSLLVVDIFWCDGLMWRRNANNLGLVLTMSWLDRTYLLRSRRARFLEEYPGMSSETTKWRFRAYINVVVLCRNCAHTFVQLYELDLD